MATRAVLPQQNRGGVAALGKQKPEAAEKKNRRALGDIGNVVNATRIEGKPHTQINRPITRSFGAQLLANAQAAAAAKKKSAHIVVEDAVVKPKVGRQRAEAAKPTNEPQIATEISPHTEEEKSKSSQKNSQEVRKKVQTLTSVLTSRSKLAGGIKAIDDIDAADSENHLAMVEYVGDIYKFYKLVENSSMAHDYMDSQMEINEKMRSILVDWLIEVHHKFELTQETLYLTVHIIDRYLSMKRVLRRELQLVGVTAMLIASKYEEIWAPEVNDFVCISDKAYFREQILRMEKSILNQLEWSLTLPTPYVFLQRFLKAAGSDKEMEHMVFFFAELALMQYCMVVMHCPSLIAASAVYAAQCTLNKSPLWSETLCHHTGYTEAQIMHCAKQLVSFHSTIGEHSYKLKAVYKKYSSSEFGTVALLRPAQKLLDSQVAVDPLECFV